MSSKLSLTDTEQRSQALISGIVYSRRDYPFSAIKFIILTEIKHLQWSCGIF